MSSAQTPVAFLEKSTRKLTFSSPSKKIHFLSHALNDTLFIIYKLSEYKFEMSHTDLNGNVLFSRTFNKTWGVEPQMLSPSVIVMLVNFK